MSRTPAKTTKAATTTRTKNEDKAMPATKSTKTATETKRTEMTIEMVKGLKGDALLQAHELVLGTTAKPKTPVPVLRSRIIAELERRAAAAPLPAHKDPAVIAVLERHHAAIAADRAAAAEGAPAATSDEPTTANDDAASELSEPAQPTATEIAHEAAMRAARDAVAAGADAKTCSDLVGSYQGGEIDGTAFYRGLETAVRDAADASRAAEGAQVGRASEPAAADASAADDANTANTDADDATPAPEGADAEPRAEGAPDNAADSDADGDATEEKKLPPVGTEIHKRDRHGAIRATCKVVEGGIEYAGKTHTSLSAAAVAAARDLGLTTKTLNGWVWWGLTSTARPASTGSKKGIDFESLEKAWNRYRERAEDAAKSAGAEERASLQKLLAGHATALLSITSAAAEPTAEVA